MSIDGAPCLEAAVTALRGEDLPLQRCTLHKHRNRLVQAPKRLDDDLNGDDRDMINDLLPLLDQVLLGKRCIIETLFEVLKSSMGLGHTRHRWPGNALVPILSCLAAYTLAQPKVNIGNIPIPAPIPAITT